MALLCVGLIAFLGIHLLPAVPRARQALVDRLGAQRYKGLFSLISAAGIVLIVAGFRYSGPRVPLFEPLPAAIALAPYAVTLAFILFAAANMRSHLRRMLKHPMLLGTLIWSAVHLLANGDRAGTVLFAAFLVYATVDLISAVARRAVKSFVPEARFDAMAIGGGIGVALIVMWLHRALFGVPVVPFGA
jgi:uncharacterized membrane protein